MLIEGTPGFERTGSYESCEDILKKLSSDPPDIILMDIEMPGINGIEGMKQVKKHFPEIKILMQTVFDDDDRIFESIMAGASGYILKNTPPAAMLDAITEAGQGGAPMSPSIASRVLQLFQAHAVRNLPSGEDYQLSKREKEVLKCLVDGKPYKIICDELCISYATVRTHMRNIYEKLHVCSMTEAVSKALRQGLF